MTDDQHAPELHPLAGGGHVAYRVLPGRAPTVVFLCGYGSDMSGTKARFLHRMCAEAGQGYLRFDYRGRGASTGRLEDGTIGSWTGDACSVIEAVTKGPLVLVGSSMGGWIMLLAARCLAERVKSLVGVAAAPDFTEDRVWAQMSESERETLATRGVVHVPSRYSDEPYPVTLRLIEDGRERLQLRGPNPPRLPGAPYPRLPRPGRAVADVASSRLAAAVERCRGGDRERRRSSTLAGHRPRAPRAYPARRSWHPWYLTTQSSIPGIRCGAARLAMLLSIRGLHGASDRERFCPTRTGRPSRSGSGRRSAPGARSPCTRVRNR